MYDHHIIAYLIWLCIKGGAKPAIFQDQTPNLSAFGVNMTPAQYTQWKAARGEDAAKWELSKCHAADTLVRRTALANAKKWIKANIHKDARYLFDSMLSIHFGSVEVDDFLTKINAYPKWL